MKKKNQFLLTVLMGSMVLILVSCIGGTSDVKDELPTKSRYSDLSKTRQYFGKCFNSTYEVEDEHVKDINDDGVLDSIVILTPSTLLPESRREESESLGILNNCGRVLLVKLSGINNPIELTNIVSNDTTTKIKNGSEFLVNDSEASDIVLFKEFGQGCYLNYNIYINYDASSQSHFVVDSVIVRNKCPSDSVETTARVLTSPVDALRFKRTRLDSVLIHF